MKGYYTNYSYNGYVEDEDRYIEFASEGDYKDYISEEDEE